MRWQLRLTKIEFDVIHHTSIKHQPAEVLLRLTETGKFKSPIDDDIPVLCVIASTSRKEDVRCIDMQKDVKKRTSEVSDYLK